jgi:osmotically-inducible protein OsmY
MASTDMVIGGEKMKMLKPGLSLLAVALLSALAGCSATSTKSADLSDTIRKSLDQAGFKDVSASQDRDEGVVTLTGHVTADAAKLEAQSIAQSIAVGQVVSNQIGVIPEGVESAAKAINQDYDKGIEQNLDAALIENKLHEHVQYAVKNHVVTLTGEVDSQLKRSRAQAIASSVLNVSQVVNELQVTKQKATSSN